jgi:G3E family GTPase
MCDRAAAEADSRADMRITLIAGFLGAGKSTVLRRPIADQSVDLRTGVIVNDLSQLEFDSEPVRMGDLDVVSWPADLNVMY